MTIKADKKRADEELASAMTECRMLRALLAEAERREHSAKMAVARLANWVETPKQDGRQPRVMTATARYQPAPPAVEQPLFPAPEADKINHVSGCGHDVEDLKKCLILYLKQHGTVGKWFDTIDLLKDTKAWVQFGKRVVDPTLKAMAAEGTVELGHISSTGFPHSIKIPEQGSVAAALDDTAIY